MKTIRLGNDISVQWTITRLGEPEVFDGKDISVQLIDKLGNPQVFDYVLNENVISGTFYGKDQVTNGTYRLLLVENAGEEYMVTLDYIDCFCLSNKMKNQTSNGSDTTSSINTEVISISSEIDLSEDLSQYAKITYVDGKVADVKTYVDSSFYNIEQINDNFYDKNEIDASFYNVEQAHEQFYSKDEVDSSFYDKNEIDSSFYNKDEVDQIIADLPASDTYTKSEIDTKIDDVSNNIPTKVSDLQNDKGYLVQNDVSTFITEDALEQYAKIEDVPTKVSELQNDSSYLTPLDVSTMVDEGDLAQVAFSGDYDDLENKPTIPEVPTNVSAFNNDAGYLVANDVSTLVDEDDLSQVAFSGEYGDLTNVPDLSHFFDDAAYDSSTKKINFKHGGQVVAFIDATDFIKDGMVDNVVIDDGYVVITFNTDAGKEEIRIDITDIFNPNNYYDKDAINLLLQGKQDTIVDLGQLRADASNGAIAYGWGNHANAGYLVANDVSTFITKDDASIYLTSVDVSTFLEPEDVSCFVTKNDASVFLTYEDASVFLTIDDASIYLTAVDVSAFITANDASIFLVQNDVSTFLTHNDVSTFITENDASIYLVKDDVSTFITQTDASVFLTAVDVSTFLKPDDVSTFITQTDASVFLTAVDVSTFITIPDASTRFETKAWRGTQAQYDQIQVKEQNRLYIILPDSN